MYSIVQNPCNCSENYKVRVLVTSESSAVPAPTKMAQTQIAPGNGTSSHPALARYTIIGGGPAGLYTAILLRNAFPNSKISVFEQNPRDATFGFGVVFSDQALSFLKAADAATHDTLLPLMERWDDMIISHPDGDVTIDGVGFASIGRLQMLQTLQTAAQRLEIDLHYSYKVDNLDESLGEYPADLIIGADGLNSLVRASNPSGFSETIGNFGNYFAWFGATKSFPALTQTFRKIDQRFLPDDHDDTADLPLFVNAHHYRYGPDASTFIVETDQRGFDAMQFASKTEAEAAAICSEIFADTLEGSKLITNKSNWRNFPRLWCDKWIDIPQGKAPPRVLIGDAAHTCHFSIGSGTRLAFEDAQALVNALSGAGDIDAGLADFQTTRQPIVRKIVRAANRSARWYDGFSAHLEAASHSDNSAPAAFAPAAFAPAAFAKAYITRSGRVPWDRLAASSPRFVETLKATTGVLEDIHQGANNKGEGDMTAIDIDDNCAQTLASFDRSAHTNCSAILFDNLTRNPDKPALIGDFGALTYGALCALAARWGQAFIAEGLQKSDRILFLLADTPNSIAAFFGAVRVGLVPVLVNPAAPADLINYYIEDCGAKLTLVDEQIVDMVLPLCRDDAALQLVCDGNPGELRDMRIASADDFIAGHSAVLDAAKTSSTDLAFFMYSSGSTGRPKGIVHLHHDMAFTQASYGEHVLHLTPSDICFSVPKLFFAYGFGNSVTFPFSVGATSVLLRAQPSATAVLHAIETFRPSVFFGLPTLFSALCRDPKFTDTDLSSIRLTLSAAEVLAADLFEAWKAATGRGPVEGLGSTELLHIYLSNTPNDQRIGAAGTPVPGYEVRLLSPDGTPTPGGDEGVMEVRGDSAAPCYWNKPDKTAHTMRDGWIHTGDLFEQKDGYYYFRGRSDDLIKISGQWVWPLEVEGCLQDNPEITEAAVLAYQLSDKRYSLHAFVVLGKGGIGDDTCRKRLQDYVKTALLPYKYPRSISFVDALPKTGTGKIDRQALIEQLPTGN
jgi:benzoate-CoA ligase family protein